MKYKTLQVGITGGIGSGKTTVCKIFEAIGIPVYYADERAKKLMIENISIVERIIDLFGPKSYFKDGSLNRKYIANIVFNDQEKLNQLNSIVHPAVKMDALHWHLQQINVPYTLKEAALMIESGNYRLLDKLIVVSAPIELRIDRVMKRDDVSKQEVVSRMTKQMPEQDKLKYADYKILNDGTYSLIKQVWEIHRSLIQLSLET